MAELDLPERHPIVEAIYRRAYEDDDRRQHFGRAHLGASVIGRPCDRALWYSFRWATDHRFDGRMLRLFDRGQREEALFVAELRAIGCEVHDRDPATGEQWQFAAHGGHFGGSMDAAVLGVPGAEKTWHVAEFKTANDKSFKTLAAKGVEQAKPEHYAQMQAYMKLTGMRRALYLAVNKNDDELYAERVKYDKAAAEALLQRALDIITADEPPTKLSEDPAFWQCKFCEHHRICHSATDLPEIHCRTCAHATAELDRVDARWSCAYHGKDLPLADQRAGCDDHLLLPPLVAHVAELVDADSADVSWIDYRTPNGTAFRNGPRPEGYSSKEIRAAVQTGGLDALADGPVQAMRDQLGAEIVNRDSEAA